MDRLEELLLQTRALTPEQLERAKTDAQRTRKRLAQTIIDLGIVDDKRFAQWMAHVSGTPLVDPLPAGAVHALERRIPRGIAREYEIAPIAIEGDVLTVATVNPLDESCASILRTTTGMSIRLVTARYGPLTEVVTRYYPEDDAEQTILPPVMRNIEKESGNETIIAPPPPPSQLDRIEKKLDELSAAVKTLETALQRLSPR